MTEHELRALVRAAIARHRVQCGTSPVGMSAATSCASAVTHASHALFVLAERSETEGCVIEPTVRCNHCGYCKSYGH